MNPLDFMTNVKIDHHYRVGFSVILENDYECESWRDFLDTFRCEMGSLESSHKVRFNEHTETINDFEIVAPTTNVSNLYMVCSMVDNFLKNQGYMVDWGLDK
ncbi:glycoside hydrolase [Aeromonas phage ZPAH1]|nr:hypothetical protein ASwh1_85 [Aeromonas phage Aswh_1]QQG33896.1 glycoside hydrolase [Aeromonas phage ZPAH1]